MPENRLIHEQSPYLLQHANNPVDWYPWAEEAFEKAKTENKPVFLSIGYAACHWCHVMEKESFEDEETARILNETFVCIKVDREERPDIDSLYMTVCQMLTGSGGWPLTIFMTPEKLPFFAATYIPKESGRGMAGLKELCMQIDRVWNNEHEKITQSIHTIEHHLKTHFSGKKGATLQMETIDSAVSAIRSGFDPKYGGFGNAPKFPTPHRLMLLLSVFRRTKEESLLEMVKQTLKKMAWGGIWDHVGFGFHRYSTDTKWLLPHFEKMLYDQALLAMVYLEIFEITKEDFFAKVAKKIFTYVLRDMQDPSGGFYSAEDADSEGEEGKFYVWTKQEFEQALKNPDPEEAQFWEKTFHVEESGNFLDEATKTPAGKNILHLDAGFSDISQNQGLDPDHLETEWEEIRERLFKYREKRVRPLLDDKILTDWNGLMITALACGARVLKEEIYKNAAVSACKFILGKMTDEEGRLYHRYRNGETGIHAHADDYAFIIQALLELYHLTFDPEYLKHGATLQKQMIDAFWDEEGGGFFLSAKTTKELPVRPKEIYDGAIPSANSVSLMNLVTLSRLTGDLLFEEKAEELIQAFSAPVSEHSPGYTFFLTALHAHLAKDAEIVIAGERDDPRVKEMLCICRQGLFTGRTVMVKSRDNADAIAEIAPFTKEMHPAEENPAAYVCQNRTCKKPVTDAKALADLLSP